MIAFLKLVRYKNLLMVLLTLVLTKYALINGSLLHSNFSNLDFFILAFSILCITAAGYIINDIFDIETDKINKPHKQYISNNFTKKNANFSYYILNSIGLLFGVYISLKSSFSNGILLFIFCISGLFFYSKYFKRIAFIGNLLVSFLISFTIIILYIFESIEANIYDNFLEVISGLFSSVSLSIKIFTYALFAFFINLLREIIKDIEDIKGDYSTKMKTLPILIGINRTNKILLFISSSLLFFVILVIKELIDFKILLIYTLTFILIPFIFFIYKLWLAKTPKHYHQLSKLLKLIMFFGIISMLLFKFK